MDVMLWLSVILCSFGLLLFGLVKVADVKARLQKKPMDYTRQWQAVREALMEHR